LVIKTLRLFDLHFILYVFQCTKLGLFLVSRLVYMFQASVRDVDSAIQTYADLPQSPIYHQRLHFESTPVATLSCHQQQRSSTDDVTSSTSARPRKVRNCTRRIAPATHGQRGARQLSRTTTSVRGVIGNGMAPKKPKTGAQNSSASVNNIILIIINNV